MVTKHAGKYQNSFVADTLGDRLSFEKRQYFLVLFFKKKYCGHIQTWFSSQKLPNILNQIELSKLSMCQKGDVKIDAPRLRASMNKQESDVQYLTSNKSMPQKRLSFNLSCDSFVLIARTF